ncbi:hypothetical protein [Candidatus Magnetaquicoccus inordinatus]|uniref:hypothetical protein n=1 Tax=Candidatus Magnetaquicoccus inordinatus TaxID=2496818 RepID=UPI00102CF3B2|nr:hypothetical protein [Candidatus Magnetaquicoccus inordinatus]
MQDVKQQRRYQREQVLEEGKLTIQNRTMTVDVLDVSLQAELNKVQGFGIIAPHALMAKSRCTLHLPSSRYAGEYNCIAIYSQDTGFGMRIGLQVEATAE